MSSVEIFGGSLMSMDMSAALDADAASAEAMTHPAGNAWIETALTVLFTAATVLFASFIAVVTGLV
jgi:hypothetical protein